MAYDCRKAAELLNVWIKKSENKSDLESFSKQLHSELSKATILLQSLKRMSLGREKMWRTFHELFISSQFREVWKTFFAKVIKNQCILIYTSTSLK